MDDKKKSAEQIIDTLCTVAGALMLAVPLIKHSLPEIEKQAEQKLLTNSEHKDHDDHEKRHAEKDGRIAELENELAELKSKHKD